METNKRACTVMIVEDDMDLCRLLERIVAKRCNVFVDHSIKDAESHLDTIMPDIVLLDNNLPDGLGIGTIAEIREVCPEAKVVLMTADVSQGLREEAIRLGAYSFIAKPFPMARIREIISTLFPEDRAA
jgi:DNA-binding NtrC family response regulator